MTWVRKDDAASVHQKFFRSGVAAYGWWDAALGYCNRHLSDGFVPARNIELVFPGTPSATVRLLVEALVRERSLHVVTAGQPIVCHARSAFCPRVVRPEDGYVMHDYFEYQPRRSQVLRSRRKMSSARSAAGRKGGVRSGEKRKQVASVLLEAKRSPDPTRPDPTRSDLLPKEEKQKKERKPVVLLDDRLMAELRVDPAYKHLDVDQEAAKYDRWLTTPRGRGKLRTYQRFVGWLNRAEPSRTHVGGVGRLFVADPTADNHDAIEEAKARLRGQRVVVDGRAQVEP
jgi:hypothetical protein